MDYLQTAILIATEAHQGQFRRDGKTPYITHPQKVANLVESKDAKAVSWLHDVLEENTDFTVKDLFDRGMPEHIVDAVVILTKSSLYTYEEYLERVKENELARTVKIADMMANLSDTPTKKQVEKYTKGLAFLQSN